MSGDGCQKDVQNFSGVLRHKGGDAYNLVPQSLCVLNPLARKTLELPSSKIFFQHYLHRTAAALSARHGDLNPFVAFLVPMGMANNMILHGLLTLGGVHYAYRQASTSDQTIWLHYGQMVKSLIPAITKHSSRNSSTEVVELFMGTILLCVIESLRGDGASALLHVKASRQLLLSTLQLPRSLLDESTRALLCELYVYVMATSAIPGQMADVSLVEDSSLFLPIITSGRNARSGLWCGAALELFLTIPQVSLLTGRLHREALAGIVSLDTKLATSSLQSTISTWTTESTDESFVACGKLYQQALLVCLGSPIAASNAHPENDSVVVQEACWHLDHLLESLPIESPISTTLCWPLVVIGLRTKDSYYQNIIRQRLTAMMGHLVLRNIQEVLRLLECVWANEEHASDHPLTMASMMLEHGFCILFI
ncbi:hypothetical protein PV04_01780 [Phialophora macrospora]|uniref:Transcription factor domain-containing protein n=1 Tax=Phialophora macrospora TaxID=1851006 RepID=A0A0D2EH33_9EURO|nr:hypothetical protein PV04_01780 [Phialophora macrospora]